MPVPYLLVDTSRYACGKKTGGLDPPCIYSACRGSVPVVVGVCLTGRPTAIVGRGAVGLGSRPLTVVVVGGAAVITTRRIGGTWTALAVAVAGISSAVARSEGRPS